MSIRKVDEERIKELANSIAENESKIDALAKEYENVLDQLIDLDSKKEDIEFEKHGLEDKVDELDNELRELEDTLNE